jgi:alpha-L-fucosidase 2
MKLVVIPVLLLLSFCSFAQSNLQLWYTAPAKEWTDALPVGNGRLGGMVHGRTNTELIQLNEESVWAGSKINNNNPLSAKHLPEIQQLIFKGKYKEAVAAADKYMVGTPPEVRSYQPLGNLYISYHGDKKPDDYRRSLSLETGISKTEYVVNGSKLVQEVYVSAPQDVMVVSIRSERPIDTDIMLSRERDVTSYQSEKGLAYFIGQIDDPEKPKAGPAGKHMRFSGAMKLIALDGKSTPFVTDSTAGYQLSGATNVVFILTGATDYNFSQLNFDKTIDPLTTCKTLLNKAATLTPIVLRQRHVQDHQSLFNRVKFELGDNTVSELPTNERLDKVRAGGTDLGLISLYYQYGRYLLMASSRKPGKLPANLQGIWNQHYQAPWNADFHTNINLQMNYWPAESGNLPETAEPLNNFMKLLTIPGSATAKEMYGTKGWTLHHLTDPFGRTGVADGVWGVSPMAGPWMTFPVYEHYLFTKDLNYLKNTAYPIIKGSVEFVLGFLIESPEGYLVTNPSHSPENAFYVPGTNRQEDSQLSYASTVDVEIIQSLFNNYLEAASALKLDAALVKKVMAARKKLPPFQVAANGTLQEWIHDYEEVEPGHRHISHLLGLFPQNLISPKDTTFFEAAKKTIERRLSSGGGHTGWSRAWIVNFYARLFDGEKAGDNVQVLLGKSTLNNLFDTHPPFQIDGNFGGAAGIAEMLLQSQNGELHILPALPPSWANGSIKGLKARNNYIVDITWKDGELIELEITAPKPGVCKIRYGEKVVTLKLDNGTQKIQL